MAQHLIKYLNDPIAAEPKEIGFEFMPSYDVAMDRVAEVMPELRAKHGPKTGYRIEDMTGRIVMIGPGRGSDA